MHERGARYLAHTRADRHVDRHARPVTLDAAQPRAGTRSRAPRCTGGRSPPTGRYTYLFAHCYRQFGFGFLGHDPCTAEVRVARVPRGQLDAPRVLGRPGWVADPAAAVNIAPPPARTASAAVNPMQIAYADGRWIAVTKEGDWWGTTIYLDQAPGRPGRGPPRHGRTPTPLGDRDHNTYFASLVAVHWRTARGRAQQQPLGRPTVRRLPADVRRRADGGVGPPAAGSALSERAGDGGERLVRRAPAPRRCRRRCGRPTGTSCATGGSRRRRAATSLQMPASSKSTSSVNVISGICTGPVWLTPTPWACAWRARPSRSR